MVPKRRGRTLPCRLTQEAPGLVKKLGRTESGQEPLLWFLREREDKAGSGGLRLASLNNFSRLWGIGTIQSCLISALGMIRTEEYCFLECKSQMELVQSMSSVFLGLHMKGMLHASHFLSRKNWLPLGRVISLQSARRQMSEHQKYRKRENIVNTKCRQFIWKVIPENKVKK